MLGFDRTGVYGDYDICKTAADRGLCRYIWQAGAWAYGHAELRRHLRQHDENTPLAGGTVDLDTAYAVDFGQYGGQVLTPAQYTELKAGIDALRRQVAALGVD